MSINKVILVGHVGADPEVRYIDNNVGVATIRLATSERGYTTREGVQVPERTEWHSIVAWRGLADVAEKYIKKGSQLYVEGKLRTRVYEDSNGVKKYITEIIADTIQMLGKPSGTSEEPQQDSQKPEPQSPTKIDINKTSSKEEKQINPFLDDSSDEGADDDLPF